MSSTPTPEEIVEQAVRLKDYFEQNWCLPWIEQRQTSQMWRHRFVHLLAQLPPALFAPTMESLLEHPSFALRGLALHLVRMRGDERFCAHAERLFSDPSPNVRALAAAAVGQFAGPGWEVLLETKDGEHAECKKAVVSALERIRDVRCIPLLARWVGRVGEDDELRRKACEALAAIGDDAAMPVLTRVLEDDSVADEVRGEAARAIGLIGKQEGERILLSGLSARRPWIRARCAQGIGLLGRAELASQLFPLLGSEEPWMVRTHALEAVGRLLQMDALPHILPLLLDPDATVRGEACVALGRIDAPESRHRLKAMLDDAELSVRLQAFSAYSRLVGEDFGFRVEDHQGTLDPKALRAAVERARAHRHD